MTHKSETQPNELDHQYFLELAATAPKLPLDDERVQKYLADKELNPDTEAPGHTQFGNNFYLLFAAMMEGATPTIVDIYYHRAKGLGQAWEQFELGNQELVLQLKQHLQELDDTYGTLMKYERDLYKDKQWGLVDEVDAATEHPFGLEAIGMHVWDKINPLLMQASQQMEAIGISSRQFYG